MKRKVWGRLSTDTKHLMVYISGAVLIDIQSKLTQQSGTSYIRTHGLLTLRCYSLYNKDIANNRHEQIKHFFKLVDGNLEVQI
jgi:hypothetical protein